MDQQQLREFADRFIDALHRLERGGEADVEPMVALFSPNARLSNAAMKLTGKTHHGADGARHFWTEYRRSFDKALSEFSQITTGDRTVGLFWTTKGHDSTGAPVEYDGASLLVLDEQGAIIHFHGYYDTRALEHQVRALGSPET